MRRFLHRIAPVGIILIISVLFCLDLFIHQGRLSAFDTPTHLANIAQFTHALQSGDFPVRWMDGFANYGMPMGVIVQQTTPYLGALFNLLLHNTVLSYNLVVLVGTFLSLYFFYLFLRLHFSEKAALLGTIVFAFAPYRIINVYIRGDIPEFFAHVFFPVICIGLYYWIVERHAKGLAILFIGLVGILLTHPFTLVIGSFLFVPYTIALLIKEKRSLLDMSFILPPIGVALLALGAAGYYIIPLFSEIKYFYYGRSGQGLLPGQNLTLTNYLGDHWYYFTRNDIDVRGHVIHLGLFESIIIGVGPVYWYLKDKKSVFIPLVVGVFAVLAFFTTQYADPIYLHIKLLGGIQHNWRMFTSIVFIAPLLITYIQNKLKSTYLFWGIIFLIIIMRVPQLYGKNFLQEPDTKYYWNKVNLHGNILNTVWTGPTEDYPVKQHKGEIIAGQGIIIRHTESNSWRTYEVRAQSELRMVDNTFYFPGWHVYVDGVEATIEFQDMNYRGVITYKVPPGTHTILVQFTNTKVRLLGNIITAFSLVIGGVLWTMRKKLLRHSAKQRT